MERPDIEAALERASKATKGPWQNGGSIAGHEQVVDVVSAETAMTLAVVYVGEDKGNADFIIAARTDVPALAEYALHMEAQKDIAERLDRADKNGTSGMFSKRDATKWDVERCDVCGWLHDPPACEVKEPK